MKKKNIEENKIIDMLIRNTIFTHRLEYIIELYKYIQGES